MVSVSSGLCLFHPSAYIWLQLNSELCFLTASVSHSDSPRQKIGLSHLVTIKYWMALLAKLGVRPPCYWPPWSTHLIVSVQAHLHQLGLALTFTKVIDGRWAHFSEERIDPCGCSELHDISCVIVKHSRTHRKV